MDSGKNALVVGGGIIGLCSAFYLNKQGWTVTVVSQDPPEDTTACGSAGAIAMAQILPISAPGLAKHVPGWLFDPLGPLSIRLGHVPKLASWMLKFIAAGNEPQVKASTEALASLMWFARNDHFDLLSAIKAEHLLRKNGNLWIYKSEQSRDKEAGDWALRKHHGIQFSAVNNEQIREREPALGKAAHCGYFIPDWCHYIDPEALVTTLAEHLHGAGVTFVRDSITGFEFNDNRVIAAQGKSGNRLSFDSCLIAAGARSVQLSSGLGDNFPLESERGYNTTLPNTGLEIETYLTFEEHFVLTPMTNGLRIGGAAEFAGLDAAPNYARSKALVQLAKRYLPNLIEDGGTQWMGHRPSTPDSRPVISASTKFPNIFYGFGHGHIGLTLGPTTGRLLSQLISGTDPEVSLSPFDIGRYS